MNSSNSVSLFVYDISNGMARSLSPMLLGKVVEGVWHTSIVVFGKEYYFQGGIAIDMPKTTPFGHPVKTLPIGVTELSEDDLNSYLFAIRDQFTPESYNIFDHNCNHFSNTVCEFLTGAQIPKDIMGQANEYKNTPIGKLMQGFENQHKNVNAHPQNSIPPQFGFPGFGGMPQQQPANPTYNQSGQGHSKNVHELKDIISYTEMISGNDKVIVDFYANWCGPCKMIKPEYERLADANVGAIKFCSVNVDTAQDIASTLGVKSMPTFLFMYQGTEVARVVGGDPNKLRGAIDQFKKGP